jgi:hypothetical protein
MDSVEELLERQAPWHGPEGRAFKQHLFQAQSEVREHLLEVGCVGDSASEGPVGDR